jgi:hypothetical protein
VRVPGSHPSLVGNDDFRKVQDRLNARRTSYSPRVAARFLLSGLAQCGYCGNKLIGVSRKQAWKRQSGERVENSYRYYQCESRTNQSVCSYHTRRADDLEREVRAQIARAVDDKSAMSVVRDMDVLLETQEAERARFTSRLRTIDKRIEGYVGVAAKGRLSKDRMHTLSVAAATDRLAVEDALDAIERRMSAPADADQRQREREAGLSRLLESWDALPFLEHQAELRDALSLVVVTDDSVTIELRP